MPSSPPGPASKPPDPRRKLIATADLPAFPGPPPRIDPLATAIEPAGQRRDGTSPWGGAPAQPRPEAPRRPDTRRDSETDQVPIDSLLEKVRGKEPPRAPRAQPWDEVIAKAPPATLERWGTTPEAEADTALALPALKREPPPERPAPRPPARSGTATETSLPKWSELPGGDTVRQPPLPSPPSPPSIGPQNLPPAPRASKPPPPLTREPPAAPSRASERREPMPKEPTRSAAPMPKEPTRSAAPMPKEPTRSAAPQPPQGPPPPSLRPPVSPRDATLPPFTPTGTTLPPSDQDRTLPPRNEPPFRDQTAPLSRPAPGTASPSSPSAAPPPPSRPPPAWRPSAPAPQPRPKTEALERLLAEPARGEQKSPIPPMKTAALPWEVSTESDPQREPELRNAPVVLPPGRLTSDLALPDEIPSGPLEPSINSGTMVGLLSPIDGSAGAGDVTRLAPEGALAGLPPKASARPPAAKDLTGDLAPPSPGPETGDDPGFSQPPSFDDAAGAHAWDLRAQKKAPPEPRRSVPPLDETRAFASALPSTATDGTVMPRVFGANEQTAQVPKQSGAAELRLRLPGTLRRMGAALVDAALLIGAIQGLAWSGLLGEAWAGPLPLNPDAFAVTASEGGVVLPLAALGGLLLLASTLSTALLGRSPGKLLFGMRVVTRRTGTRPGFVRAFLRAIFSVLGLALAGAGYLWGIVDRDRRSLHDVLTGTTVVRR